MRKRMTGLVRLVQQYIHWTRVEDNYGPPFFAITAYVKNWPARFNINNDLMESLKLKLKFTNFTPLYQLTNEYRDEGDGKKYQLRSKETKSIFGPRLDGVSWYYNWHWWDGSINEQNQRSARCNHSKTKSIEQNPRGERPRGNQPFEWWRAANTTKNIPFPTHLTPSIEKEIGENESTRRHRKANEIVC